MRAGSLHAPVTGTQRCPARTQRAAAPHGGRTRGLHATTRATRASPNGTHPPELDAPIELVDGRVTSGPDLSVVVNGLTLPNPFVIGSGPPGTNYQASAAGLWAHGGNRNVDTHTTCSC